MKDMKGPDKRGPCWNKYFIYIFRGGFPCQKLGTHEKQKYKENIIETFLRVQSFENKPI